MLQRFMSKKQRLSQEDGEVEIELDLGLSLNGRFGVDPLAKTRLMRSSSVFDLVVNERSSLSRTCSLPVETEEEWRKRKELQSLRRRLEAKRKRSEKQRKHRADNGGDEKVLEEGSIGSSGSGSSGLSEVDAIPPPVQATTNMSMETSPSTSQSQPENQGREASRNIMEDMPCVSTIGDGPNGKKIDGFLYRYRKGEEVRIVCVCHGSFLSPAEFVKHAGGSDVAHPLKHIVVNLSPFS
ncbi:PREDICTED: ninja-family protein AFP3 [Camelina sativa]|uniref:Ninja-family protein n=1 Tax=Camelina sativa TaxID=90675 RepID=A0ABM0TFR1_CAMSA|nr:PREDICTED: ninja-family protein AFP3 [Camelina sativa]XP_010425751.1 PREDICTED: ninja-family protein AFP3 [Camelina sativa]